MANNDVFLWAKVAGLLSGKDTEDTRSPRRVAGCTLCTFGDAHVPLLSDLGGFSDGWRIHWTRPPEMKEQEKSFKDCKEHRGAGGYASGS
jgi:hypothetical protein